MGYFKRLDILCQNLDLIKESIRILDFERAIQRSTGVLSELVGMYAKGTPRDVEGREPVRVTFSTRAACSVIVREAKRLDEATGKEPSYRLLHLPWWFGPGVRYGLRG